MVVAFSSSFGGGAAPLIKPAPLLDLPLVELI
jgi:hypothetical protein